MRVIAGKVKGARLRAPSSARPTTERVRGAIFSILTGAITAQSRVLDLYAGSGALGIEALSRGAGWADFVEQNPRGCAILRQNLLQAGLSASARVYCAPVKRILHQLKERYHLVLMDPPYAQTELPALVEAVARSEQLLPGGFLVVSHSSRLPLPPALSDLTLVRQRRHGDTSISIYRKGEAQ